jgi:hypothetical protein
MEHLGSAHDKAELEALKAADRQRVAAGQLEFDLGAGGHGPGRPLPITSSRMGHLVDALKRGYRVLGFEDAAGGDDVFRQLVLARVIEPVSKLDSIRVLEEAGVAPPSYRTIERRLSVYAEEVRRQRLTAACAAHARLGPASLVLYDVSTLPSAGGWRPGPAGPSGNSSRPPAATAPSGSRPDSTPSPPRNPARRSPPSHRRHQPHRLAMH